MKGEKTVVMVKRSVLHIETFTNILYAYIFIQDQEHEFILLEVNFVIV